MRCPLRPAIKPKSLIFHNFTRAPFQADARYFVVIFRFFRLECRVGSCNVYQSVKLLVSCQIKATGHFASQRNKKHRLSTTRGITGHAVCMAPRKQVRILA
jgi:hypothetical protein